MASKKAPLQYGQTLKLFRVAAHLSQEELAEKSDLDRTYISMLERDIKSPTLQTMIHICEALGVSLDRFTAQMTYGNVIKEPIKREIKLPLMGTRVACGTPVGENHFIEKEITLEKLIIKHPEDSFVVQAMGDSMSPTINSNDYLIIDKNQTARNGQIILAQVDNEFTVKRFFKEGKQIILKADNPLFETIVIDENKKFVFCGSVISVIKNNL